jgi:hypothetical protein
MRICLRQDSEKLLEAYEKVGAAKQELIQPTFASDLQ